MRGEVTEASRDEQFSLLPPQTAAAQKEHLFFQRRYTPSERFAVFSQSTSESQSGELLRNMPQIRDALVYCPSSNEILFQAPPMEATGKFIVNARPTRVYIYSLTSGKLDLVWRREKDREGTFVPRMSATPDCRHVLLNLQLEKPGNKVPFGELIYLRKPSAPTASAAGRKTPPAEWTFSTINESAANGVWRGFGEALFVLPRDPARYVASEIPPAVFAITDMVEKDRNVPLVNVFSPSGGARISQAGGVRWRRDRVKAESTARDFFSPTTDDSGAVFLAMESNERNAAGAFRSSVVAFEPARLDAGMRRVVDAGEHMIYSVDVHPSGARLALSYVEAKSASQAAELAEREIAGVAEFTLDAGKPRWSALLKTLPFHALEAHYDPRPIYSADGGTLYYVHPQILDLPDASLFAATAKTNKELQFGSRFMRIGLRKESK